MLKMTQMKCIWRLINTGLCYVPDEYEDALDNPYLYLWVFASVVSSCYAYTWDIKMDWGLFDKSAGENKFLREETVYSSTVSNINRYVMTWTKFCLLLYFSADLPKQQLDSEGFCQWYIMHMLSSDWG